MLILYSATILNLFFSSYRIFGGVFRVFNIQDDVICRDHLTSSFPFGCLLFLFLAKLLQVELLVQCRKEVVRVGLLSCPWPFRKSFQLFIFEYDVNHWFVIYGLYYPEIYFLYILFVENFYHKNCCICPNSPSICAEMIIWFILPVACVVYSTFVDLQV